VCLWPMCSKSPKIHYRMHASGKQKYVDTGSKYRGSGIVSHGERVSDAKDVNWNKNESTRNLWRPR
jgi:hypothetical protein